MGWNAAASVPTNEWKDLNPICSYKGSSRVVAEMSANSYPFRSK